MQKGVKNTSLADISAEVGISKGTLYYHYPNKDDLIYDVTDVHLKRVTDELLLWIDNIENDAAPEEILAVVFEKILAAETRGKLHLYLIGEAVTSNELLKVRFREKYKEWKETLEEGLQRVLKNREVNYKVLSQLMLAALDGFTIQWMLEIEDVPVKEIALFLSSGK